MCPQIFFFNSRFTCPLVITWVLSFLSYICACSYTTFDVVLCFCSYWYSSVQTQFDVVLVAYAFVLGLYISLCSSAFHFSASLLFLVMCIIYIYIDDGQLLFAVEYCSLFSSFFVPL